MTQTVYINQNHTLNFSNLWEAEKFADTVERKTGKRPEVRESRPQQKSIKNLVSYCKIAPDYTTKR